MGDGAIVFGRGRSRRDNGGHEIGDLGGINEPLTGNGVLHEGRNTLQVHLSHITFLVFKFLTPSIL